MLRWNPHWRFAASGSPEKEERLLYFAAGGGTGGGGNDGNEPPVGPPENDENPDEGNENPEKKRPHPISWAQEQMRRAAEKAVNTIGSQEYHRKDPTIYFNEGNDFKAAYEKKFGKISKGQILPPSFEHEGIIYFNAAQEAFEDEATRKRTLTLELAEFYTRREEISDDELMPKFRKRVQESGVWEKLIKNVDSYYGGTFRGTENDYARKILSLYIAGDRHSFEENNVAGREIVETLRPVLKNDRLLREIARDVRHGVDREYPKLTERFKTAVEERKLAEEAEKKTEVSDEEMTEGKKKAVEDIENSLEAYAGALRAGIEQRKADLADIRNSVEGALKNCPPEEKEVMERTAQEVTDYLNGTEQDLETLEENLDILEAWEVPGIPSKEKKMYAEKWKFSNAHSYRDGMTSTTLLDAVNRSQRKEFIRKMERALAVLDVPFKHIREVLEDATQDAKQEKEPREKWGIKMQLYSAVTANGNIRWMSPYDMIKLFKIYKEAVTESYHSQQKIRVHGAVKDTMGILRYMPYGIALEQIMKKQVRAANDEETSKFAEYVKSEGFTYDEIFGEGQVLDQNKNNVNRCKAIIEYAADHGWLYKMDKKNGHNVYGVDFEGEFGTHSFLELINRNEAGKNKEEKRGEERVKYHEGIPLIIEDMHDELKKKNIFAVRGMLKVLQDKAKKGHSNTWGLVTLLRHMRRKKEFRDIMDTGLLDSIGSIGITQAAWSLTLLKMERGKLEGWKFGKNTFADTVTGKAIETIESKLKPLTDKIRNTKEDTKEREAAEAELDEAVAMVLACQTYRKHGLKVSIFDEDESFKNYREFWRTKATTIEPGKTDDDFFNAANDSSDVLLLSADSIGLILSRQSQGPYVNEYKAKAFLGMVIKRAIELNDFPEARKAYVDEMRDKLEKALRKTLIQEAARKQLPSEIAPALQEDKKVAHLLEVSEINILDGLVAQGLISDDYYKEILMAQPEKTYTEKQEETVKNAVKLKKEQAVKKIEQYIENAKAHISLQKFIQAIDHLNVIKANLDQVELKELSEAGADIKNSLTRSETSEEMFRKIMLNLDAILQKIDLPRTGPGGDNNPPPTPGSPQGTPSLAA